MTSFYEPGPASAEFDPAALVRACIETGARSLLLDADNLPPDFFDLSSVVAGALVHGLTVYRIPMAAVVPGSTVHSRPFQDFAREANRGHQFRFFTNRAEAIEWLDSRGRRKCE